jgi:ASC-1-like (ASCH) protein
LKLHPPDGSLSRSIFRRLLLVVFFTACLDGIQVGKVEVERRVNEEKRKKKKTGRAKCFSDDAP